MNESTPKTETGRRIRRHREKRKVTQTRLALLIGTTKQHLSMIELGKVNPSGIMRERIAEALSVPREVLWPEDAEQVA